MNIYGSLIYKAINGGGGGITPTGTKEITENGTYDVTQFASADVNVQSGGGLEYEVGSWIPSVDKVSREFVPFASQHTDLPTIVICTVTQSEVEDWYNGYISHFSYIDYYKLNQNGYQIKSQNGFGYSLVSNYQWYSGATDTNVYKLVTEHKSSDIGDSNLSYPRYFVAENGFYPTAFPAGGFLRKARLPYTWIAIWA